MILNIDNPDALRVWLTETLAPICDADPAALAKYVMALLKKDKTEQELRDFCVDQLDVFLQRETKPFVDKLFTAIGDRSYLLSPSKSVSSTTTSEIIPAAASSAAPTRKSPIVTSTTARESSPSGRGAGGQVSTSSSGRPGRSNSRTAKKGSTSPGSYRNAEHKSSRSRSRERNAGYRSSGSDRRHEQRQSKEHQRRETDKENRSNRRKSPAPGSSQPSSSTTTTSSESGRGRGNTSRKGDGEGSVDDDKHDKKRKKLRCRDFDEKGFCMRGDLCPYDHGPDPVVVDDIALPTMISISNSGSASKPPTTPGGTPNFSVPPPGYGTAPPGVHPPPPGLDAGSYPQTEAYNPEAPSISVAVPPPGFNRPPPQAAVGVPRHPPPIWTQQPPPLFLTQPPSAIGSGAPIPLPVPIPAPIIVHRSGVPSNREIVPLPDAGDGSGSRTVLSAPGPRISMIPFRPSLGGKRPFGVGGIGGPGGQAGPRSIAPYDKNNCTLEVRRVPSQLNTISKLNEHFQQFGQIVNIQLRYENDPEAALITFTTRPQAVAAYKSTAPILNNRFIKIFWHDKESAGDASGSGIGKPSIKDRLGLPVVASEQPAADSGDISMKHRGATPAVEEDGTHRAVLLSASGSLTRTIYNPDALAAAASQKAAEMVNSGAEPTTPPGRAVRKPSFSAAQPPPQALRPKMTRKQHKFQDAMKKSLELQKAKADLVKKQLEQQKLLLAQLEKCTSASQKKEIIKTIKALEKTIKEANDDLAKTTKPAQPRATSKETLEKEMLDTELELIRQKQSGEDTSDSQRRLTELRLEMAAFLARSLPTASGMDQKMLATSTPIQSMAGEVGRPQQPMKRRRVAPETAVLDKRPRDLSIGGFHTDEKDALIEHLQHYGMLEDIEFQHSKADHQACRATVVYKTRREAETALANGGQFHSRQLTIQWANQRTASISETAGISGAAAATVDSTPVEMTAEEILASLDDDEEEEEESEESDAIDGDVE